MADPQITASQSNNNMVDIQTQADSPQLSSQVVGFETFGPLYKSDFYIKKVVAPDAGADLFASAQIQASNLNITIQNGTYVPDLKNTFLTGTPVAKIQLVTLGNINGTNQMVDRVVFENCYLLAVNAAILPDTTAVVNLSIRYTKFTHTIFQYLQDGSPPGQNEASFDLTQNATSVEN